MTTPTTPPRSPLCERCGKYRYRIAALEAQVAALTAQYRPSMTDLMTDPETMPDMDEMEYDHRSGDENAND